MQNLKNEFLFILNHTHRSLSKPISLNPADWSELNKMVIPPGSSFENNLYSKETIRYFEQPLNDLIDSEVTRITFIKSSQVGYTFFIMQSIAYLCDHEKKNILVAYPVVDLARDFSNLKWNPFIDSQSLIRKNYNRRSNVSTKSFGNNFVKIKGANTTHAFTQVSYPVVIFDEMSNVSTDSGSGDPIQLAVGRTKAFGNKGLVIDGGVLLLEGGVLEREFGFSNQSYWYMPCPECNTFQTFLFRDPDSEIYKYFRYDTDENNNYIKGSVFIECRNDDCDCRFDEEIRRQMINHKDAYWHESKTIADGSKNGHKGYFINSLISPLETLDKIAEQHLKAVRSNIPSVRRAFTTDYEARAWKLEELSIDHVDKNIIQSVFEIPKEVTFLTMGADIQKGEANQNWIAYEVVGWSDSYNSYGIEYGELHGALDKPEIWDELIEIFYQPRYKDINIQENPIWCEVGLIDVQGGFYQEVMSALHRSYEIKNNSWIKHINLPAIYPCKGFSGVNSEKKDLMRYFSLNDTMRKVDEFQNEPWSKKVNDLNTFLFKDILYTAMSHKTGWDESNNKVYGYCRFVNWTNPKDKNYECPYNKKYFKGLKSESKVFRLTKTRGYRNVYNQDVKRNEPLDCKVYAYAAARLVRNSITSNHPLYEQVCKLWYPDKN